MKIYHYIIIILLLVNTGLFVKVGINNSKIEQQCPYEMGECPNLQCINSADHDCYNKQLAAELEYKMGEYQITLHMDTVWITDNGRPVGAYISNWKNQIDSILLADNQ
jgi:hypothetical protein